MKRDKLEDLIEWKNSSTRKPLIIKGARQVGKTWLMKEFGEMEYENTAYINFEKQKSLVSIFEDDFDIKRIILALEIESGIKIDPENTLIIFDEIQEVPEAITSLKYFMEDAPEYHVIAAGSLLGVALHSGTSFPVGKVTILNLYPLSFSEFLLAIGEGKLADLLVSEDWKLISTFKSKFIERLRQYYFIGGMPEAVKEFVVSQDFIRIREIQTQILLAYEQDFSKHPPPEIIPRIRMLWNAIPSQLARENRKFIYGQIRPGSRAKDYELALSWLIDCGQVYRVSRITKPAIPLKAYEDFKAFKLFMVDVGLLAALVDLDASTLLKGNKLFSEFKGALTEQYVLQELKSSDDFTVHYWSAERASSEVDFVLQHESMIIPVEVKAEENLKSKSLKVFYEKYHPEHTVRTSMSDFREQDWLTNIPLYGINALHEWLNKK
jgi:predicted AAA+ superfamily ATPase